MSHVENLALSIMVGRAALKVGITPQKAFLLLDELVALPDDAIVEIVRKRQLEHLRRLNAKNRKVIR